MASVSLVGITKSFGDIRVLDNVTLHVPDGASVAVLGPSGCGKTTLLRVVAGLEPPDSGAVAFDGQDVSRSGAQDRGIGMVFQNYALYPHMASRGNLGFFFKMHRREPETGARVDEVCEIMGPGFRDLLSRKPKELSGGEQQRVAIGRCIIRNPRVFLFDEPLSNLDARLRAQTRIEIKRLIRRFAITSFYVTHDQTEAIAICDLIAVMRRGRIEQFGAYQEIYDRPATAFVAGFIGSPPMNLLDARLLPDTLLPRLPPSVDLSSVTAGIRPPALRLAEDGGAALDVRVLVTEPLIAARKQLVTGTLTASGDGPEIAAQLIGTDRFSPGTTLRLAFDPAELHLFGADGMRLDWSG
ncbi:MAG: ABC transporter ATP-binding protein [Chloroflexota bacterium]